jgi:tripartite-type tricarboxylate transporter receptor subunit TctC
MTMTRTIGVSLGLCLLAGTAVAEFPGDGPIRVVTPYGAGGGIDIAARILAAVGEEHLGQRVEIVNMPGAGGLDAASFVLENGGDGYTLIISDYGPLITLPLLEDTPYEPEDWVPLVQVTEIAPTFVARSDADFSDMAGFIEAAKAAPGDIPITHGSYLSSSHLPLLRLQQLAEFDTNQVPTSGGGETVQFLLGNTVPVAITTPTTIAGSIESGDAVALAVASAERVGSLPDTPTLSELGYDVVMPVWYTIFATSEVPAEIVEMLSEGIAAAYASERGQELAAQANVVANPISRADGVQEIYDATFEVVKSTLETVN